MKEIKEMGKREILRVNEDMAQDALRVLGFAYRECPDAIDCSEEHLERDLIFLGLTGMIDPPREEAVDAIKVCKQAGIKPIMTTGDHRLTAVAIAKEMGIYKEGDRVLTGEELEKLHDDEFEKMV